MAASALVGHGTGTTLAATTSAWTSNLLEVAWSGIKRSSLKTSHMGTSANTSNPVGTSVSSTSSFGSETFIPGALTDPGSLKVKVQFNPDKLPPVDSAAETWTVTFPKGSNTTGAKWAATAFVTDFDLSAGLDNVMEANMTIKVSGAVTFTPAA
jgi:hypothetical protein